MFQSPHWRECLELVLVTSWVVPSPLVQAPNAKWCLSLGAPVERPPNIHPLFVAKLCSHRKLLDRIISRRKVTFTLHIWMKSLVVERVLLSSFTRLAFAVPRVMGG